MFVPKEFRETRQPPLNRIIERNPLATLLTNGPRTPLATHLPVIPESPEPARPGATLLGHLNRLNPHWESLASGKPATVMFNGPNGYVTPSAYRSTPAAPTWNYVAVHLHGTVEPLPELADVLRVVRRTVAVCEAAFGDGWDPEPSLEYFRRIGNGVGAFRFTVTEVDAQFKLSQDKDPEVRERVVEWFTASESGTDRDLAVLMRECGPDEAAGPRR